MTKQQIAAQAFRDIAEHILAAPLKEHQTDGDNPWTADQILESAQNGYQGMPFHIAHPDPTATDSGPHDIEACTICHEGTQSNDLVHNSECPVGILEVLLDIGIDSPVLMPGSVGRTKVQVTGEPLLILPEGSD